MITRESDLQAEIDALRADIEALRNQLTTGVGVPDYRAASDGDVLKVVSSYPAWGTPASGASWGSITGTLSSQTDLQSALNAKGDLTGANSWTQQQIYGGTTTYRFVQGTTLSLGSTTPASTSTWYRIATLPHTDYGVEATIFARFHRVAGGGEAFYKFTLGKATNDANTGTTFSYEQKGRYADTYGIAEARVVDGGTNLPSYLDVRMRTLDAFTMNLMANTVCAGSVSSATLGWVSQGTGAAGNSFSVWENLSVSGTTGVAGVYQYTAQGGTTNFSAIGLPGTTGQYVRGDGSLATYGGGGGVTSVSAGAGMNFTTITGTGAVALGTPSTLTASTTNSASGTTHTHNVTGFLPLTGGTLTGTLTGTTIQGSTVRETSDASIKSDVRDLQGGLDAIRHLSPRRFYNERTELHEVGFVAQDVREVLPEVVHTDEDGLLSLSYQRLVAPIVAALHEIDARLKRLESKA